MQISFNTSRKSLRALVTLGLVTLGLAAHAAFADTAPTIAQLATGTDSKTHAARAAHKKPRYQGYPSYWVAQGVATANDAYSQVLWGGPNVMGVWTMDPSGNLYAGANFIYGPFSGWNATAISVNPTNDSSRVLWANDDGEMCVWALNPDGSYNNGGAHGYGPYAGAYPGQTGRWHPRAIATNNNGLTYVLWYDADDGYLGLWSLNTDGTIAQVSGVMGPISPDWQPTAMSVNPSSGYCRILWNRTDGASGIWVMDSNLNYYTGGQNVFGPYSGWNAVAIATGGDATSRIEWARQDGTAELWSLDPNGNFNNVYGYAYGPNNGWYPQAISMNPRSEFTRVLWNRYDGAMGFWVMDNNDNFYSASSQIYGPY